MEISNLSEIEFIIMINRVLNCMKKDIATIKKLKNAISEINNALEGIKCLLDEAEN